MARTFNGSSDKVVIMAGSIFTDYPYTMATWFNTTDTGAGVNGMVGIYDNAVDTKLHALATYWDGAKRIVRATVRNVGQNSTPAGTVSVADGAWHHAVLVSSASNSHTVYTDGGDKQTDATNVDFTDVHDNTCVGFMRRTSDSNYQDGDMAEVAIWDVALDDAEIASLAAGFSPLMVRPASLLSYLPFYGRTTHATDLIRGTDATVTGTTVASHPPACKVPAAPIHMIRGQAAPIIPPRRGHVNLGLNQGAILGKKRTAAKSVYVADGGNLSAGEARTFTFSTPCRQVVIQKHDTMHDLYVLFNGDDTTAASTSNYDLFLRRNERVMSPDRLLVRTISLYCAQDLEYAARFTIRGWV
jgi:hypothetical protein